MAEKLLRLYNTLATIETKGENTKIMADCLRYTEQLITETKEHEAKAVCEPTKSEE